MTEYRAGIAVPEPSRADAGREPPSELIENMRRFWRSCGSPSFRRLETTSLALVADERYRGLTRLSPSTISDTLGAKRKRPPRWEWVACFVLCCRWYLEALDGAVWTAEPRPVPPIGFEHVLEPWHALWRAARGDVSSRRTEAVSAATVYRHARDQAAVDEPDYDLAGGLARFNAWLQGRVENRTIVLTGVTGLGTRVRGDEDRRVVRERLHAILDDALDAAGITESHRDEHLDRGDGALTLVDEASKILLLDTVVPAIVARLAEHNTRHPDRAFRLRMVVSAGHVDYDERGPYGETLDAAFRLLETRFVRTLRQAATAPMVLVVSDHIYRRVVCRGYEGIDPDAYTRVVSRHVSGLADIGWARTVEPPQAAREPENG